MNEWMNEITGMSRPVKDKAYALTMGIGSYDFYTGMRNYSCGSRQVDNSCSMWRYYSTPLKFNLNYKTNSRIDSHRHLFSVKISVGLLHGHWAGHLMTSRTVAIWRMPFECNHCIIQSGNGRYNIYITRFKKNCPPYYHKHHRIITIQSCTHNLTSHISGAL